MKLNWVTEMKKIFVLIILLSGSCVFASDTGLATNISFASSISNTVRPGTAQFSIQGGFSEAECNDTYAAIAKEDSHLISLLLSAHAQNKPVEVFLDSTNKYYGDRCLVSYIEID